MSDPVHCETCRKIGRRRLGCAAPDDWLFMEALHESSGDCFVIWACSVDCAVSLWKRGPGKLDLLSALISSGDWEASPGYKKALTGRARIKTC